MTLLIFLIVLSILIFVHEFGHFLVAKKFGIKVEEFALGFPPRLWARRKGETTYSINAIPIGGFVRLYGEEDPPESDRARSFYYKPKKVRAAVAVAGVVMNFFLAVVAFVLLYVSAGIPQTVTTYPVVTAVFDNSPAQKVGLQPFDRILRIDDREVSGIGEVKDLVSEHVGQEVEIELDRSRLLFLATGVFLREDRQGVTVKVIPRVDPPEKEGPLGIGMDELSVVTQTQSLAWYQIPGRVWQRSFYDSAAVVGATVDGIIGIFRSLIIEREAPEGVAGPIGIYQVVKEVAKLGVLPLVSLVGILSINLAVLNIVPFPALDGGRLLFIIVEALFGRRVVPAVEKTIHMVGFAILIALIVLVSVSDVRKLLSGEFTRLLAPQN